MFDSIIKTAGSVTGMEYLICSGVSLVLGFIVALVHMYKNTYSKNIIITLVVLPYVVQTMLMLVNGSIGAGIAVMGAFSLVRFRSAQGNAKEIMSIFYALTIGLAMSLGYIGIAIFVLVLVGIVIIVLTTVDFGVKKNGDRTLKITIPEDLDYEGIFDDLFDKYTTKSELIRCRTTNMGSLYEITYEIALKKDVSEKSFIDELRCRNGNLTIMCGRPITPRDDL
ncbi:MAG: DUF4956 domain-containing protein [Lachnospiraceae bacterium]|nr:DUF4956 domain-containing protein [Lachnospiraceae bacterium]